MIGVTGTVIFPNRVARRHMLVPANRALNNHHHKPFIPVDAVKWPPNSFNNMHRFWVVLESPWPFYNCLHSYFRAFYSIQLNKFYAVYDNRNPSYYIISISADYQKSIFNRKAIKSIWTFNKKRTTTFNEIVLRLATIYKYCDQLLVIPFPISHAF